MKRRTSICLLVSLGDRRPDGEFKQPCPVGQGGGQESQTQSGLRSHYRRRRLAARSVDRRFDLDRLHAGGSRVAGGQGQRASAADELRPDDSRIGADRRLAGRRPLGRDPLQLRLARPEDHGRRQASSAAGTVRTEPAADRPAAEEDRRQGDLVQHHARARVLVPAASQPGCPGLQCGGQEGRGRTRSGDRRSVQFCLAPVGQNPAPQQRPLHGRRLAGAGQASGRSRSARHAENKRPEPCYFRMAATLRCTICRS